MAGAAGPASWCPAPQPAVRPALGTLQGCSVRSLEPVRIVQLTCCVTSGMMRPISGPHLSAPVPGLPQRHRARHLPTADSKREWTHMWDTCVCLCRVLAAVQGEPRTWPPLAFRGSWAEAPISLPSLPPGSGLRPLVSLLIPEKWLPLHFVPSLSLEFICLCLFRYEYSHKCTLHF